MQTTPDVEFREVDIRDVAAVQSAVTGADVVVHMAYALYGVTPGESDLFETNVEGTLNVARAAATAGAKRFVYTSSGVVYGFRPDNPQPLTEEDAMRASARHFYSRHKAQAELLVREALEGSGTDSYIFRPCAVVGPHAAGGAFSALPGSLVRAGMATLRSLARAGLRPAVPAPPVPLQFVHEDDVAQAVEQAALGNGPAGVYNLAGDGAVDGDDALHLIGLRVLPLPRAVVRGALRLLSNVPPLVPALAWQEAATEPLMMDTTKAREQLGWAPRWTSRAALEATRAQLGW
jgi:nucleoside-diphosphate-sugar epimerase